MKTRQIELRPLLLIAATAMALRVSAGWTIAVVVAYVICDAIDDFTAAKSRRREMDAFWEDEVSGWQPDEEDPDFENKENLSRARLKKAEEVLFYRLMDSSLRSLAAPIVNPVVTGLRRWTRFAATRRLPTQSKTGIGWGTRHDDLVREIRRGRKFRPLLVALARHASRCRSSLDSP